MSVRDFLIGFIIGSLATALLCFYVFMSAIARASKEIKSGLDK